MKSLHGPIKTKPDYIINACTNTGVWVVQKKDPQNGIVLAEYDFVNRLYSGMETGGSSLPVESIGGIVEQSFTLTQKELNLALLHKE